MSEHTEYIHCPNCGEIEQAEVLHTMPWYSYVHFCTKCGYTITESEWNKATEEEVRSYQIMSALLEKAVAHVKAPTQAQGEGTRRQTP